MTQFGIMNDYFEWLFDKLCKNRDSGQYSFKKLLTHLHNTEFRYLLQRDSNRAMDGIGLRYRFAVDQGHEEVSDTVKRYLDGPCSVLEMMTALAIRCEEDTMSNTDFGDRTRQWFWDMVVNLGLGSMTDDRYDKYHVDYILNRFLDREYEPDGKGGLFRIKGCDRDLRTVEIWYQLCWYLDNIT